MDKSLQIAQSLFLYFQKRAKESILHFEFIFIISASFVYLRNNFIERLFSTQDIFDIIVFFLGLCAASGLTTLVIFDSDRIFKSAPVVSPGIPLPAHRDLHRVFIDNVDTLKIIQNGIVRKTFGDHTPDIDVLIYGITINPRRSIAIYNSHTQNYVGLASLWPITPSAADRMIAGKLSEKDLAPSDMLPASQNRTAKNYLLAALAVENPNADEGKRTAVFLLLSLRRLVLKEFGLDKNRKIRIIAIADSDRGREMCETFGMTYVTMAPVVYGVSHPLYAGYFSGKSIKIDFEERI